MGVSEGPREGRWGGAGQEEGLRCQVSRYGGLAEALCQDQAGLPSWAGPFRSWPPSLRCGGWLQWSPQVFRCEPLMVTARSGELSESWVTGRLLTDHLAVGGGGHSPLLSQGWASSRLRCCGFIGRVHRSSRSPVGMTPAEGG